MSEIELHAAFAWDCDECGAENFCRGVTCSPEQFTEDEEAEMREEHGIEPWDIGEWMMAPDTVTCCDCGAVFSAKDWRETD